MQPEAQPTAQQPLTAICGYEFASADFARIHSALAGGALIQARGQDALRAALTEHPTAQVLIAYRPPQETQTIAPGLRWIALPSAGADHVLRTGLVRADGPIVTTANGVHAVPISEFVVSLMLLWARRWPALLALQRDAEWPSQARRDPTHGSDLTSAELNGATLAIVGLGAVGRRVAQLGRAFGMRVVATRRSATVGADDPDVDQLLPPSELPALLAQADYLVLTVPSTHETRHLINARTLALMKPSAYLINVARGSIINEADLVAALEGGVIAGAGLDVFEVEPLPSSSPLWRLPNVIVAPHISGLTMRYGERFADLFLDNLARFRAGQPLRNVVDPARGY